MVKLPHLSLTTSPTGRGVPDVLPVLLDVLGVILRSLRGEREDAQSLLRSDGVGLRLHGGDPYRRMGRLLRLWVDSARGNVPEVALPLELLFLAPDAAYHVERLVPDGAGIAGVDLEALLLVGVAPARAEVDASAGYVVGHGDLLGDADRVLVRQDDDAEAEADALRGGRESADDYLGRGGA